jgi:hypothetical protein
MDPTGPGPTGNPANQDEERGKGSEHEVEGVYVSVGCPPSCMLALRHKHDIARAASECWKTDMDGILVFVSMPVYTFNASQALTLSNRSLDRCLLCDTGRIPRRKLQITQA